jgi:hypothetical protein
MILRTSLVVLFVLIAIIMSQFIKGVKVKIMYWMIIALLFIVFLNIYMTALYYIKIRNNPGVKGERGPPGKAGQNGARGVCVLNTKCMEVYDCRNLIKNKCREKSLIYKQIIEKQDKNQMLSDQENRIIDKVNSYVELLAEKCKNMNKEQVITEIAESLDAVINQE